MESTTFNTNRLLWLVAATGLCIGLAAFQQEQKKPVPQKPVTTNTDTIPKKKESRIVNLDDALEELDEVQVDLDDNNLNIELTGIGPEIEKAIRHVKIDVTEALKDIDMEKIAKEIEVSMKDIDWKKIQEEVDASLSKVDWKKINRELQKVDEVKMEKLEREMKKLDEELKRINPGFEKSLEKVKIELERAKKEMKEYKTFLDGLESDGLINKQEGYTIKQRNGELFINGQVQPAAVYSKYHQFLEKHRNLSIEKSEDNFKIDLD